ncbi:MAG TPA: class I SAM-dependent methyltransferase [Candidatus Eisenbacteria bacterium]|jgi:SAM-dependent methyltransferase
MTDWDARYAEAGWAFGTEPNDFLREQAELLPRGRVLCLAEGEGRNAVWLAGQGFEVTAVDLSSTGLEKAQRLASERGVRITTVCADLATYAIEPDAWEGIVSIFAHVPAAVRARVHGAVTGGLVPGGVFLLEAYRPQQIGRGTGGPNDDERMVDLARLRAEVGTLEWLVAREVEREVVEGHRHTGMASVVQLVARRRG